MQYGGVDLLEVSAIDEPRVRAVGIRSKKLRLNERAKNASAHGVIHTTETLHV
jgi:hypothetical protein